MHEYHVIFKEQKLKNILPKVTNAYHRDREKKLINKYKNIRFFRFVILDSTKEDQKIHVFFSSSNFDLYYYLFYNCKKDFF